MKYGKNSEKAASSTYMIERRVYSGYHLLLLSAVHALCVRPQPQPQWSYIPCTPSEYLILLRLLDVQGEASVPFQELFPQRFWPPGNSPIALQRHISRLKKKLPPGWSIVCKPGSGYRLRVPLSSLAGQTGNTLHSEIGDTTRHPTKKDRGIQRRDRLSVLPCYYR